MLDEILEAGSTFDWISPAGKLISGLRGKTVGIDVWLDTWGEVEQALRRAGIRLHYAHMVGDKVSFSVDRNKFDVARRIIERMT
jgi:hypothetical protein